MVIQVLAASLPPGCNAAAMGRRTIASDRNSGWLLNGGIFDDTTWNVGKTLGVLFNWNFQRTALAAAGMIIIYGGDGGGMAPVVSAEVLARIHSQSW